MGKESKNKAAEKKSAKDCTPYVIDKSEYRIPIGQIGTSEQCSSCSKKGRCVVAFIETLTKEIVARLVRPSSPKAKSQTSGKTDPDVKSGSEGAKSKARVQKWGCEAPIAKLGSKKRTVYDSFAGNREEREILIRSDKAPDRKVCEFISLFFKRSKFPPYVIMICLDLYITKKISPDRIVNLLSQNDIRSRLGLDSLGERYIPSARLIYNWYYVWKGCLGDQAKLYEAFFSEGLLHLMNFCTPEAAPENNPSVEECDSSVEGSDGLCTPKELMDRVYSRCSCFLRFVTLVVRIYSDGSLSLTVKEDPDA